MPSLSCRWKLVSVLAVASSMIVATLALAHEGHEEEDSFTRAIEYRTSVMNVFGWNFKSMGEMLKGKRPYNSLTFSRHARDLAAASSLDLLSGFPEDSDEDEDTDAMAEIWMEWDDFEAKFQDLRKRATALQKAAEKADPEGIKRAFDATGKACKACHKKFKE